MKRTTEIDFAENPDKVDINDLVFYQGKIGKIVDYAVNKPNFLKFWVLFDGETIAQPCMADNLKKVIQPQDNFVDTIFLDLITIDSNLQQRIKLDNSLINDYADIYREGIKLPPITIWNCIDDGLLYLVDGFHRYYSAKKAGLLELPCNKLSGSYREAVLFSVGVNSTHGLKRSNEDKRKSVLTLLQDEEWSQWSNRAIALQCGVSHQFVNNIRQSIWQRLPDTNLNNSDKSICDKNADINLNNQRKVRRSGKTYIQDTTNIGKGKEPENDLHTSDDNSSDFVNNEESCTEDVIKDLWLDKEEQSTKSSNKKPRLINPLSVGDEVKVSDNHYFGGKTGVVAQIPNSHSVMLIFDDNQRDLVNLSDLNPPLTPKQPYKRQKKEIILEDGLNYFARTKGGNRWYVEVSESTYQGLKIYQQQIRAIDIEKIFRDFLLDKGILKVHPDDCTILYLGGNNG